MYYQWLAGCLITRLQRYAAADALLPEASRYPVYRASTICDLVYNLNYSRAASCLPVKQALMQLVMMYRLESRVCVQHDPEDRSTEQVCLQRLSHVVRAQPPWAWEVSCSRRALDHCNITATASTLQSLPPDYIHSKL